jgi:hypothetical protein
MSDIERMTITMPGDMAAEVKPPVAAGGYVRQFGRF